MATDLYAQATVLINGTVIAENTSVKITRDSKANVVETLGKGFAGVSVGAKMITVSVDNAVPSADFEFDPGKYIAELRVAELTIFVSNRTLTTKGFFLSDDFQSAVNSPSSLSFSFVGEYASWV